MLKIAQVDESLLLAHLKLENTPIAGNKRKASPPLPDEPPILKHPRLDHHSPQASQPIVRLPTPSQYLLFESALSKKPVFRQQNLSPFTVPSIFPGLPQIGAPNHYLPSSSPARPTVKLPTEGFPPSEDPLALLEEYVNAQLAKSRRSAFG